MVVPVQDQVNRVQFAGLVPRQHVLNVQLRVVEKSEAEEGDTREFHLSVVTIRSGRGPCDCLLFLLCVLTIKLAAALLLSLTIFDGVEAEVAGLHPLSGFSLNREVNMTRTDLSKRALRVFEQVRQTIVVESLG